MYSYIQMESRAVREVLTPLRLPFVMPGGVVAAQGPLEPLTQVRILAGQPVILYFSYENRGYGSLWAETFRSTVSICA